MGDQVAVNVIDEEKVQGMSVSPPPPANGGGPLEKKLTLADLEEEERLAEGNCVRCVRWWVEDWHFKMNPLHAGKSFKDCVF
jgi:hypothetical protein